MSGLRVLWAGMPGPAVAEVEARLCQELPGLVLERAEDAQGLRQRLAEPWDLVLADPAGREAVLAELCARGLSIPVVLLAPQPGASEVRGATAGAGPEVGSLAGLLPSVLQAIARRGRSAVDDPAVGAAGREEEVQALEVLVAGLAHDLNNLLLAISGHGEIAREELVAPESARRSLDEILRAVRRARHLVDEIRSLGRAHERAPAPIDVVRATEEAIDLLAPALPPGVRVERRLPRQIRAVLAAEGELQRIVLNLAANAIEALGGRSGTLEVALDETELEDEEARSLGLPSGTSFARLTVGDDGGGMDTATRDRAFEPFFSTKGARSRRGLGLSVVRGIVHARGGAVALESQPGRGTQVRVWLPTMQPAPVQNGSSSNAAGELGPARYDEASGART